MKTVNYRMNDEKKSVKGHSTVFTDEFVLTKNDDLEGVEISIISDEVLDFITNNSKKNVISEKNKVKKLFLI